MSGSRCNMLGFILYTFCSMAEAKTPMSYEGSQVLLVESHVSELLRDQLKSGKAEVWRANGDEREIFVMALALDSVYNILDEHNVNFTVLTKDIQEAIDKEHSHKKLTAARMLTEGKKMSWDGYHRLKVIHQFTEELAKDHPRRVQVVNIGQSVHGRNLKVAIFKSGLKNAKRVWIDGGIHAREWISPAAVTYIMNELVKINGSNSSPLSKIDFYICPVVNPDGYEFSHTTDRLWRKNRRSTKLSQGVCHGVDLNRNFKSQWKPSKKCDVEFPGQSPESEPETKHMSNFISQHIKNMEGFITFHSYSQVVLYPYAYPFEKHSDIPRSSRYLSMVKVGENIADRLTHTDSHKYRSLRIYNFTHGAYGSSVDWAMDMGIKYPYAIELRPNSSAGNPGFLLPPDQIVPTAKEALAAVVVLATAILQNDIEQTCEK